MHLRHSLPVLAALALLALIGSGAADDGPCQPFAYAGKSFTVCTAESLSTKNSSV